jgi:5-methylcytosine-specific restriction endonuclease McrA
MVASGVWYWKDHPIFLACLAKFQLTVKESEKSLWQADHIVPVSKGGGLCDLSNYRTLCLPCHKEITKKDRRKPFVT